MTSAATLFTAAGPLRRQWFAVARPEDIEAGPVAVRLLGKDLVLWRSPSGAVVAAPDRCTHSKRPLSKGTVSEGRLVCAKHGWTFGDEGRCVFKPSGLPITENAHLITHSCTERHGLIWVSLDEPAVPLVDLEWSGNARYQTVHSDVSVWQSNATRIMEAALAQTPSRFADANADVPFLLHGVCNADDNTENRWLLACAPVDGRSSVVSLVVWSTGGPGGDASVVDEAMARLSQIKSTAEEAEALH